MQELEKILEEIDNLKSECLNGEYEPAYGAGALDMANAIKDIIRSLSRENDSEITRSSRDTEGWIPVEERLPKAGEHVLVSFRSAGFLPATAIISENGRWSMLQGAKGFNDVTEDVIAWRPLPEPYRPKKESEGSRRLREREEFFKG